MARRGPRAILTAVFAGLLLLAGPGGTGPGGAAAGTIAPAVEAALRAAGPGETIDVIVTLSEQADLGAITARDRGARRAAVITTLRAHAGRTQAPLIAALRAGGASRITPLWIINGVAAALPAAAVEALAELPGVAAIRLDESFEAPVTTAATAAAPEWNIAAIGAPALWDMGYSGQGVVVANLDTGVDADHPDLADRWRGGTNSWFDPSGEHGTPFDAFGHGTQTMGVMVGGDAGATSIGVAPGARWIAVKIFNDRGSAQLSGVHQGFQWVLDPDGDAGTDDGADVVNNSWGFAQNPDQCILEFEPDIAALKAAGVAVVFSAGNNGPGPSSDESPANNPSGFAAGAVGESLTLALFSSRGPSACDATIYPEVVAPGVNIRTSDLSFGGMPLYYDVSGTSFAAPHVAGAMALLLSAAPNATPAELETALKSSALDGGTQGPDNDYGYGLIDVLEAFYLLDTAPPVEDADGDGYSVAEDCNDDDANVYPGAPEIKHDGIDQDCNGFDLTIEIVMASHDPLADLLSVAATSYLLGDAGLELQDYGPMGWNSESGQWEIAVQPAGGNPATVTVFGVEGSETAPVTTTAANNPPVAVDDGATTPKTTPVRFNLTDNDTDPDGNGTIDKDSIVIATRPNKGLVTVHNDGTGDVTYDWNRSKGKPTSVDFQYTVDDTDGATSNLGLVTVTFGNAPPPANQAPTANPDTYNTPVATTLNRPPPGVLGNDGDPDGDAITAVLDGGPSSGTLNLNANGSFDYSPAAGAIAGDVVTFDYHASDGLLSSAPATVTINITAVANAGPVGGDDAASRKKNVTTAINIGLNDSDADGIDWTTLRIVAGPAKGAVVNTGGGWVNYIANGKGGSDSFQYTVEDTLGAVSNVATVTLTR